MGFLSIGQTSPLLNKNPTIGSSAAWSVSGAKTTGMDKKLSELAKVAKATPAMSSYRALAVSQSSGFSTDRYAPNLEQLDRTSMLDDITPKSDSVLMSLFEMIYEKDAVAGPATDLISTLPWSDWSLSGIDDPAVMHIYEDAMEMFDPVQTMPELTREYLAYGKFISSLLYDRDQGTWTGMISHNPKYVTITATPIRGFDPLLDLTPSPEMKVFLESKDKRFDLAKTRMPEKMMKDLKKGLAPLEPLTTLFVPRKVTTTDWKGTSMFMRILPYYAIEKALMQSTISAARRRTRSILHLTVGIEGTWEPQPEELDAVTSLFQASEEDPVGAIIATRSGIEANEVRSGADFWKISEEADFLKTAKMNAFGLSESFLTGEASYNTMEASLSVFVENLKSLRANLEKRVFEDKIFDVLARAHNLVKRKQSDLAHGVRTSLGNRSYGAQSIEEGMKIPRRELMLPKIHWTKNLSPSSDANYIELLKSIQEQGIPVTMKMWCSAGGIDLNDLEQTLDEDKKIRERFKKFKPAPPPGGEEGGGDGGFGAFSNFVDTDAVTVLGSFTNHDDHKHGNFFGVPYKTLRAIALDLTSNNVKMRTLRDNAALSSYLNDKLDGVPMQIEAAKYMLTRMNLARATVSDAFVEAMATKLSVTCANTKDKKTLKALKTEVEILATIHQLAAPRKKQVNRSNTKNVLASELKEALKHQHNHNTNYAGA